MNEASPLPPPRGKFSRIKSIRVGTAKWLFISGVAASVQTPPDTASQTRIVFETISHLLGEHGATLRDIVKTTAFLASMADYDAYNNVRNELFSAYDEPPASTAVEARLVEPKFLIEVEAVAVTNAERPT